MEFKYKTVASAISLALAASSLPTNAFETDNKADIEAEKIIVLGSRSAPRSVADSAVPIDIIDSKELAQSGFNDLNSLLTNVVPSYNVTTQAINDAATMVRPANLRGLPADNTLVLVNGKRRHRSSVIAWTTGGVNNGSHGPDISVIPNIALKQVEVLRDGAAAQYGSDAIAGVLNFQLKDAAEGGSSYVQKGQYYEGDGDSDIVATNIGLPLTDHGFINLSLEYSQNKPTDRAVQRADAQDLIDAGNTHVPAPAQAWGNPEIRDNVKFFVNSGFDISENQQVYWFGNYADKEVEGGFYFRNPNTRGGVFGGPNNTLLVGDLTPDDGIACPTVTITNHVPDPTALQSIKDDPNCFSHYENLPGGFTPKFGGVVNDVAVALGTKGELDNGLIYDVSASIGQHSAEFKISDTLNSAMGPDSPRDFTAGEYIEQDSNLTVDVSYPLDVSWSDEQVNLAGGLEYRNESFEIIAGEPASYSLGDTSLSTPLYKQGFNVGANGFPGFKPQHAGKFDRSNIAAYVDVETYVSDNFMLNIAARYEDFSDFGSTTNGKVSAHWQVSDQYALRASAGTGFRAPTLGQSHASNVSTSANEQGLLVDQATLSPTNPLSVLKGGKQLQAEDSTNFAIGTILQFDEIFITLDYFNVKVTDRITQTKEFKLSANDITTLEAQGILDASSYESVRYFTNDFDTTTQGIDLVANYATQLWNGDTKFSLAYNWTDTTIDDWNTDYVSETVVKQMEDGLPSHKTTFTISHQMDKFSGFLRTTYFGEHYEAHAEVGDWAVDIDSAIIIDAEVNYAVNDNINVALGAQNLFDQYPSNNPFAGNVGAKYPPTAVMGFSGGFYYLRATYNF